MNVVNKVDCARITVLTTYRKRQARFHFMVKIEKIRMSFSRTESGPAYSSSPLHYIVDFVSDLSDYVRRDEKHFLHLTLS